MKKVKPPKSVKAKDNMGLAFKYAQRFCPPDIPVEDSEAFADALIGLAKAERDFDPSRGFAFSTCAYSYMRSACFAEHRTRCRQDKLQPYQVEEEWQLGLSEEEDDSSYVASAVADILKGMKLEDHLQFDLEILLTYYLEEMTLKEVGERYELSRERIRQRMDRIKKHLSKNFDFETLEESADVGSYRDGIQRWWEDDFDAEVLSKSQTVESGHNWRETEEPSATLREVVGTGAY